MSILSHHFEDVGILFLALGIVEDSQHFHILFENLSLAVYFDEILHLQILFFEERSFLVDIALQNLLLRREVHNQHEIIIRVGPLDTLGSITHHFIVVVYPFAVGECQDLPSHNRLSGLQAVVGLPKMGEVLANNSAIRIVGKRDRGEYWGQKVDIEGVLIVRGNPSDLRPDNFEDVRKLFLVGSFYEIGKNRIQF